MINKKSPDMASQNVANAFPPGEILKEELEARGWSQVEFAEIIGKDTRLVSEIVGGKRSITPDSAMLLSRSLGTSAQFWLNLEASYQLSKVPVVTDDVIEQRARLHSLYPVREMIKRGWIDQTNDVGELANRVKQFFCIDEIGGAISFGYSAKKTDYSSESINQIAWLCRARQLARAVPVASFTEKKAGSLVKQLKLLAHDVEEIRKVPMVLAEFGIRLVVVEGLAKSKLDGACFWLDDSSPVIALSLRYDRVDNFWRTLFHEIDHVVHGEGKAEPIVEFEIAVDGEKPEIERRANQNAAELLVPRNELEGFIARVGPLYSEDNIDGFAARIGVHPAIVIGQLQNRKAVHWSFMRNKFEKVREVITSSAMTDGYGKMVRI